MLKRKTLLFRKMSLIWRQFALKLSNFLSHLPDFMMKISLLPHFAILNKRTIAPIAILIILFNLSVFAQENFQLGIGPTGYERGKTVRQLPDGGFLIGGFTESYGLKEADMLLIRADAKGNILWSKSYGGPERELINDFIVTANSEIMIVGEKYQADRDEGEFLAMLKADASGNLIWQKMYDEGANETEGFGIAATPDGNYFIAGFMRSLPAASAAFFSMRDDDRSVYLLKIDGKGNKIWSRRLDAGAGNITTGTSVAIAPDGGYMVAGSIAKKSNASGTGTDDARNLLVAKVNPDGSLAWAKEYRAGNLTSGMSIKNHRGGGFVISGTILSDNAGNLDYLLVNVSADGAVAWAKSFGGPRNDSAEEAQQTPDGGFLMTGSSKSFDNDIGDILLIKTDKNGNLQWSKIYGGQNGEYAGGFTMTEKGFAFTGEASIAKESFDVLLMKTDWNGKADCWGNEVSVSSVNIQLTVREIPKAASVSIEKKAAPPGFIKADVNNIKEQKREVRVINICK